MNEIERWTGRIQEGFVKCDLPMYMQEGVIMWVVEGIPGGDFLMAVMENDLKGACMRADDNNQRRIFEWAKLLYNDLPAGCHGSKKKVAEWKGLRAMTATAAEQKED